MTSSHLILLTFPSERSIFTKLPQLVRSKIPRTPLSEWLPSSLLASPFGNALSGFKRILSHLWPAVPRGGLLEGFSFFFFWIIL